MTLELIKTLERRKVSGNCSGEANVGLVPPLFCLFEVWRPQISCLSFF